MLCLYITEVCIDIALDYVTYSDRVIKVIIDY